MEDRGGSEESGRAVKLVRVQLCAFAQDPVFSTEYGEENRGLMEEALGKYACRGLMAGGWRSGIEVLGTTPYVETSRDAALRNIDWAITTALKYDLHLDFHLDYNLDEEKDPEELLVWHVLERLVAHRWPTATPTPTASTTSNTSTTAHPSEAKMPQESIKTVVLGHCTALTLLSPSHLTRLSRLIHDHALPVSFVGLPTSDLYMMGRAPSSPEPTRPFHRPRGTLNPISLSSQYSLSVVLGVNNVGNAFTPFGTGDPLQLASWGVGIYHAGTERHAWGLYECVSWGARRAIGLSAEGGGQRTGGGEGKEEAEGKWKGKGGNGDGKEEEEEEGWETREGQRIGEFGLLLIRNEEYVGCPGRLGVLVPARQRCGVRDVVWDVPDVGLRRTVR